MITNIKSLILVCLYIHFIKAENVYNTKFKSTTLAPKTVDCKCVPNYQCKITDKKIDKPIDYVTVETNKKRNNCSSQEVCCLLQDIKPAENYGSSNHHGPGKQIIIVNQTISKQLTKLESAVKQIVTAKQTDKGQQNLATLCGYRSLKTEKVLETDPFNASAGVFPWSVVIYFKNYLETTEKLCVGTLIDRQVVLTLASCISRKHHSRLTVRAGKWNEAINEPLPLQYRKVQTISIHPNYSGRSYSNDIALLKLFQPFGIAENVNAACFFREDFDYSNCIAPVVNERLSDLESLEIVKLSLFDPVECQNSDLNTEENFEFNSERLLCAKKVDRTDVCLANIGSALVCPLRSDPKRYTQVGIFLWDFQCVSGIYVDVLSNDWINQELLMLNYSKADKTIKGKDSKLPSERTLPNQGSFQLPELEESEDQTPKQVHYEYKPFQLNLNLDNYNSWFENQQQIHFGSAPNSEFKQNHIPPVERQSKRRFMFYRFDSSVSE